MRSAGETTVSHDKIAAPRPPPPLRAPTPVGKRAPAARPAAREWVADPERPVDELLKLDFEFYALLTQAGKNRVLQLLINTIRSAVDSYAPFFAQFNPPPAAVREHHRELLKAVAAHQPDRAAELADGYLAKGIEQLQRARG